MTEIEKQKRQAQIAQENSPVCVLLIWLLLQELEQLRNDNLQI